MRIAALVCAASWLASLALPAVAVRGGPSLSGFEMLLEGWQGLSSGVPSWYANPIFVIASVAGLLGRARPAGLLAGVALLLALTAFAAPELAAGEGRSVPPISWQIGFLLWLAAQAGLFVYAWLSLALHLRGAT